MWTLIENGLWVADYRAGGIPACRSVLLRLPDQSLLVYSPAYCAEKDSTCTMQAYIDGARALGDVRHVVIPSNFHTLGMRGWAAAFPDAVVYAELSTSKRMRKFGLPFTDWRELVSLLPDGAVMDFAPLKFGELWLYWPGDKATLLVCDAFFNMAPEHITGISTVLARILDNGPGLKMSKIVKWMRTKDKSYGPWARAFLEAHPVERLIPSHGGILESADLVPQLMQAMADKIPLS